MRLAISSPEGPGDVAVEDGDVVGVDAQQLQRGVTVAGDVGRDRFQAQPVADGLCHVGLVLDDQHAHGLDATNRHISPAYRKPHTCWQHRDRLDWRHEPTANQHERRTRRTSDGSSSPACWSSSRRSSDPRSPAVGVLVLRPHRPSTSCAASASGALGEADGAVPDGATVFDDEIPAVANLDPDLLGPCATPRPMPPTTGSSSTSTAAGVRRRTRSSCFGGGRRVRVGRGSSPVGGDAGDVCPRVGGRGRRRAVRATAWLSEHGAAYGLCQIYDNEPWHYELRPEAVDVAARPGTPTRRRTRGCSVTRATRRARRRHWSSGVRRRP